MAQRDPSPPTFPSWILRYGIAVLSVVIASGLSLVLKPFDIRLTPFLMAVGATVWYAGAWPGVVAIVLSIVTLHYFFVPALRSASFVSHADLIYLTSFALFALVVGWVSAARRRAEQALRQARDELDSRVVERTADLRRSEAYLAEAQKLNRTGSWAWNVADRELTHCSQEIYRLYGFDPQKGTPSFDSLLQRIHPDDRDGLVGGLERSVREKTDHETEFRVVLPDGTVRYINGVGRPVLDATGNVVEVIGAAVDVTERKKAEEVRQAHVWFLESMDKVNRAIQSTNDLEQMMSDVLDTVLAIFDCDRAWLVVPCDPEAPSWRAQMEHTRPAFPGVFSLEVDMPMDAEIASVFRAARACDGPVRFGAGSEHPVPARLAERFSVKSILGMAIYPKVDKPYMFGLHQCSYPRTWTPQEQELFREIGRRMTDALTSLLMLRNLRESEARLEEAQRIAHVGYWDRNFGTGLINWSDESYRIFGLSPEEGPISFARFERLVHPDDRESMIAAVGEAVSTGRRFDEEYRIVRPNGEVRFVHSRGDVLKEESGQPRLFGIIQDITERKRAETALREAQTELAHVNRVTTMGQLAASIAHEVNQPVAAAVTNAQAALRWLGAERPQLDEVRRSLDDIIKDANRAADVIGRIRALIKNVPPRDDLLDLNGAIVDVIGLTRSELTSNGVSLRTELARGLPSVRGDRVQLQQVVLNLIVNAIEATSDSGDGPRGLTVCTHMDGSDAVVVAVRDSGPGLEPEALERLFHPFYTTKPGGMGMGLSICRSIIEAHGGRIWATANVPRGAAFHFTLPVARSEQQDATPSPAP